MASSGAESSAERRASLGRLLAEHQMAVANARRKLRELEEIQHNYTQLKERLTTLPTRLSHPVTVPLNSVGFFTGQLIHTNEMTVLLSSEILVQVTATKALEIVSRRVGECRSRQEKAKEEIRHFSEWEKFTAQEKAGLPDEEGQLPEGGVDIHEEFDESRESQWRQRHAERVRKERAREREDLRNAAKDADEEALWQRLEELELQEEIDKYEELQKSRDQDQSEPLSQTELELRLSEEDAVKDIVVNRPTLDDTRIAAAASSGEQPKGILKRRPSTGSLKSVHFEGEDSARDSATRTDIGLLDSDDDDEAQSEEDDAFTGLIVERSSDTGKVIGEHGAPPREPKRISRFKASKT